MPLPLAVAELLAPRATPLPIRVGAAEAPAGPALSTGIAALDEAAPGGVPRGRLTEVVARRGGGRTTLLRGLVERTVADGGWVAVVDAGRTLAPRDWARAGESGRLWVVRPEDATRAAWCADVLLRSGAFALVVLDGAPPLARAVAVRLTRLARETGAAFVVAGETGAGTSQLAGALRLRVSATRRGDPRREPRQERHRPAFARPASIRVPAVPDGAAADASRHRARAHDVVIAVLVEKGGIHRTVEVSCAIELSRRLCAHPEVPDRRGVARRPAGRRAQRGDDGGAARAGADGGARAAAGSGHAARPSHPDRPPAAGTRERPSSPFIAHRGRQRAAAPDFPPRPRARALG